MSPFTVKNELLDYDQYDEDTEYKMIRADKPVEYDEATGEELLPRKPKSREERAVEADEERVSRWIDGPRIKEPTDGGVRPPDRRQEAGDHQGAGGGRGRKAAPHFS